MEKNKFSIGLIAVLLLVVMGCKKMDDYRTKYMANGPINYTGKIDSVKILPGRNRVKVTGLFTSDPNIVKYRVYWNGKQNHMDFPVKRTSGVDTAGGIVSNLPEGSMSFEIRTYNAQGDSSIAVYATANVYGDLYQSGISNRLISNASMQTDSSALVTWADVNATTIIAAIEIKFQTSNNVQHDTIVKSTATGLKTSLPHIKLGTTFSYRTGYLPATNAIDTFWVAYQSHGVQADVSKIYLSNYQVPFTGTGGSRFQILGSPWVTNAAAENLPGGVGGFATDGGGQITFDTWDGGAPIANGIVYQVTSSALPAGSYTVAFVNSGYTDLSTYLVAASGGSGIPTDLSTALGSVKASFNNTNNSFSFTLTSPQYVSIGVLVNQGLQQWVQISKIALIKN